VFVLHPCSVLLDVYSVLSLLFDYMRTRLRFIPWTWSITGVPSSQALPGFLITAPPSVCVPDAIGVVCGFQTKPKKKIRTESLRGYRDSLWRRDHL